MLQSKEADVGPLQFAWGDKKGRGKDNAQFYRSFTYDGVEYSLYDCVFLYHEREPEPYIGKIIKIWEQPVKKRRVKILWFFRPVEIRNFLRGHKEPIRNEVFLACGSGAGLFNVNPLEAIAGKCHVICTSMDKRNPQPVVEDLKLADYVFYRTFDVATCTISEKFADDIAGVDVKYLFNWKEGLEGSSTSERAEKNEECEKSPLCVSLTQEGKQDLDKNVSVAKADPKSELGIDKCARKASLDLSDDRASKKTKHLESSKLAENLQKNDFIMCKQEVDLDDFDKKTSVTLTKISIDKTNKVHTVKFKHDDTTGKHSDKTVPSPHSMTEPKIATETVVVPRKPEDASKWFTGLPWEDRIQKAHGQGTLLLLENFDIFYTSEEIEDLVYHFFKKKCTARVIEFSTFSNPYNGQALIICKSRGEADEIVKELRVRVLMLSNRRPLIARRVSPRQSGKTFKFRGHLHIDKLKHHVQRIDWIKAVSTSHCSQPNTIEYEMGVEWELLQERSRGWWKELHKMQKEETRRTMKEAGK